MRKLLGLSVAAFVVLALGACRGDVLNPESSGLSSAVVDSDCDVTVPEGEPTISDGIDAASSGAKVCVTDEGSPYVEQVLINKDLTLKGFGSPTIQAPSDPGDFTIPESGPTWEPIIFAFGGSETVGDVSGSGTIDVEFEGFTIDGTDRQPNVRRSVGIFYRNVEGEVSDNTVENMGVGGKETFGILAYGDSDVKIRDNSVSEYERGGIGANGDGGAHPSPEVIIADNEVTGSGDGSETAWGPNGIQVGFGASGRITDNEVSTNRYSQDGFVASCILVFESDGVKVNKNTIDTCDIGIAVGSWAWFLPTADGTSITGNNVTNVNAGVRIRSVAFGLSMTDPSVSNTKIANNELTAGDLGGNGTGISLSTIDASADFDPILENTKIIRNAIDGFGTKVEDTAGTETKEQANVSEP